MDDSKRSAAAAPHTDESKWPATAAGIRRSLTSNLRSFLTSNLHSSLIEQQMQAVPPPVHQRRPVWRQLFPRIGLPLRVDCPSSVHWAHRNMERIHWPRPLLKGTLLTRQDSSGLSRGELLSVDDLSPTEAATTDWLSRGELLSVDDLSPTEAATTDWLSRGELLSVDDLSPTEAATTDCLSGFKLLSMDDSSPTEAATADRSDEDYDDSRSDKDFGSRSDEDYEDPFLEDGFGNLTQWRLSDLGNAFVKHMEDKMNEPKSTKKQSKLEKLKLYDDLMEQYMKASLKKYNNEENLDEDLHFEFVKGLNESLIVEGGYKMYRHFNFEAMQPGSSISLFFAEVIPDVEGCDVTCCKLLSDDDNAICNGCKNQGDPDLKHPTSDNVYVGGHVDCMFPFLIDSDSEDDSD